MSVTAVVELARSRELLLGLPRAAQTLWPPASVLLAFQGAGLEAEPKRSEPALVWDSSPAGSTPAPGLVFSINNSRRIAEETSASFLQKMARAVLDSFLS